jgi:hypothetical protein
MVINVLDRSIGDQLLHQFMVIDSGLPEACASIFHIGLQYKKVAFMITDVQSHIIPATHPGCFSASARAACGTGDKSMLPPSATLVR